MSDPGHNLLGDNVEHESSQRRKSLRYTITSKLSNNHARVSEPGNTAGSGGRTRSRNYGSTNVTGSASAILGDVVNTYNYFQGENAKQLAGLRSMPL